MTRVSMKITGAQGQGVNSVGELCAKGLKRAGYCVFGYREYMSLIKGGHSSIQIDVAAEPIRSTEEHVNVLVCFNHHGLLGNTREVKRGGVILHQTPQWTFSPGDQAFLKQQGITVLYLPTEEILKKLKAKPILGNMLITAVVWALLGRTPEELNVLAREQFGHKGEKIVAQNATCIDEGFAFTRSAAGNISLPAPDPRWTHHLLLTGSHAMGLGAVHAGVRLYAGYPMTPSSPLLGYIADLQNETGMVVKQAEDEITAAQMVSGAMFVGARALTATSGGGFDLMSETISMNAMIENPVVLALGQRPGPATGLPTWTAQGDLLMAQNTAHGEFPRCVMAVSDSGDSFNLLPEAFNLAEEFQIPVILLFDKHSAEALFTQEPYDLAHAKLRRGKLVTDPKALAKLEGTDRYDPRAPDGISPRWLPGAQASTYCAQADEHNADGTVDETAENARLQMEKRLKKLEALRRVLPEPELFGDPEPDIVLVGWGSTKGVILDALDAFSRDAPEATEASNARLGYLHYTYVWPLRTEKLERLAAKAMRVVLVEGNALGQLGMLLRQECGIAIKDRILKYDGRPFFLDEMITAISRLTSSLPVR